MSCMCPNTISSFQVPVYAFGYDYNFSLFLIDESLVRFYIPIFVHKIELKCEDMNKYF